MRLRAERSSEALRVNLAPARIASESHDLVPTSLPAAGFPDILGTQTCVTLVCEKGWVSHKYGNAVGYLLEAWRTGFSLFHEFLPSTVLSGWSQGREHGVGICE
eukprot:2225330-Rhodomonas_salina.1